MTRRIARLAGVLALAASVARPAAGTSTSVFSRGPAPCHALAFTFDLCPVKEGSGFDAPLVKFLVDHHVHATFFASGTWMASHDVQMRELLSHPFFEIGTHGHVHAHMTSLDPTAQASEIRGAVAMLAKRYAVRGTLFRPPYGEYNDETVQQADAAGQTLVMWSIVSGDPDPKLPADRIVADVVSRAKNGSVIIFHANGRGWHDDEVVPAVYQTLVETKHFAADTVSELRNCASPRVISQ